MLVSISDILCKSRLSDSVVFLHAILGIICNQNHKQSFKGVNKLCSNHRRPSKQQNDNEIILPGTSGQSAIGI